MKFIDRLKDNILEIGRRVVVALGGSFPEPPIPKTCPRCSSKLEKIIQVHHKDLQRSPHFYRCTQEHYFKDDNHVRRIQREMQLFKEGKGTLPHEW